MFTKAKNIDTAFRHIRLFSIVFLVVCLILTVAVLYLNFQKEKSSQGKVYILYNGKVLEAFASERKENIPVEARDHISTFHHYFFSLDPDNGVIESNISKALNLADNSAKRQYENLKENGYYANIISGNITQEITTDSIRLNLNEWPAYFRFYGTQKIIRTTSKVYRSLITEGYLRSVSRSDNNPHGFLIERWNTLENRDIKTESR